MGASHRVYRSHGDQMKVVRIERSQVRRDRQLATVIELEPEAPPDPSPTFWFVVSIE